MVRAFKSTLEDLEERLSAHSLSAATLRSRLRAPPDLAYIDDDAPALPARAETTIF